MLDAHHFDNTFARLPDVFYTHQSPLPLVNPELVSYSPEAAALIDMPSLEGIKSELIAVCSGNALCPGTEPLAMVYAGHQFGGYSPQLGDGRALLLGEVKNKAGEKWDLHLKGAGPTPYSRFGDGRAVLRSCIREYLCSEAMYHLGIPSTRALCVVTSDTPVYRERQERGSTLLRLARTHVRFGHFEYFNYTGQHKALKTLADYIIDHLFPYLKGQKNAYQLWFAEVLNKTAKLIAQWQAAGFAHGVMNTDNMSITGDTLDYGPFGFLDSFDWQFVCNHSDHQGRYAFGEQPDVSYWNCGRLGSALMPLFNNQPDTLQEALNTYPERYSYYYTLFMRQKLGLVLPQNSDDQLIKQLLSALQHSQCDYTRFFRALCDFVPGAVNHALTSVVDTRPMAQWLKTYAQRLQKETVSDTARGYQMKQVNPKYILRNHLAQQAIELAEGGDFSEVERLMLMLKKPFDEQPDNAHYANSPPAGVLQVQVSCSS